MKSREGMDYHALVSFPPQMIDSPMPARLLRLFPLLAILVLAFWLRAHRLGDLNINWDEGYSNWLVRLPLGEMLETTARDVHPPLYYLSLRGMITAAQGDFSEFVLRYPSLLFGVLGVAAAFGFGRSIGGYRVGLIAALLLALARAHLDISQLARMHSLSALFCTGALWATAVIFRQYISPSPPQSPSPSGRGGSIPNGSTLTALTNPPFSSRSDRGGKSGNTLAPLPEGQIPGIIRTASIVYVLCTAGALYSFYLTVMLPLATNLAFLIVWARQGFSRRFFVRWAALQLTAAALFLPWALYAVARMHGWNAEQDTAFLFFLQVYFVTLVTGIPADWGRVVPLVIAVVVMLLVGIGIIFARNRTGKTAAWAHLVLLLAGTLTPILVVFVLTLPIHNLGRPLAVRYLMMLSASFYVLLAWGVAQFWTSRFRQTPVHLMRFAAVGAFILIFAASLTGTTTAYDDRILRDEFVSLANTLTAHRQPQDSVVLHNDHFWTALNAHYRDAWVNIPKDQPIDSSYAAYLLEPLWANAEGVWLIKTPQALDNDPGGMIEAWLNERAADVTNWTFNDNTLTLYARTEARAQMAHTVIKPQQVETLEAELPLDEYPVGDDAILALTWPQPPPDAAIAIRLENGTITRDWTYPVAGSIAPLRQSINLPLTPDLPEGIYHIILTDAPETVLGEFWLVHPASVQTASTAQIEHPLEARFGESITLLGYDLTPENPAPSDELTVTFYWRAEAVIPDRYKVSVSVLGEQFNPATNNPLWGQQDAEPRNWQLPTTQWQPGVVIADTYRFPLPETMPPGDYVVGVAMYGFVDGVRLPAALDDTPSGDFIPLRTFTVR
ncbi:MAG: glycosyltransferase family 39 protein [bacterium]|nr:glycosyltransferase family 39 protein [bacterium]